MARYGVAGRPVSGGLTAGLLIVILVPAVLALGSEKIRAKAGKGGEKASVSAAFESGGEALVVGGMHYGGDL